MTKYQGSLREERREERREGRRGGEGREGRYIEFMHRPQHDIKLLAKNTHNSSKCTFSINM
jgi:hypothetical protein